MLGKLMKYEIKATGRILLPLYGVLLAFTLINKLFIRNNWNTLDTSTLGGIPAVLSIFAYGVTMAAIFIVTFFIIIQRFYKNLLGDEGYLMHTLPVSTWKNISSKLLIGVFWTVISGIVAILSIFILAFSFSNFDFNFFNELGKVFSEIYKEVGISGFMLFLEFILAVFIQMAMGIIMIYASISIGHLFNKRKLLSSFGAFIVLNIIMNTITSVLGITFSGKLEIYANTINQNSLGLFHGIVWGAIAVNLIFFICYFFITNYIVKNKLNLE
ncbi:hypothetical protein UT300005_17870 [Clostridium sp. CTA-5]